jgi:hypothetical protein
MAELTGAVWRKSTRSGNGGSDCVEVARLPGVVGVRDSKDPAGPALRIDPAGWSAFLTAVKAGNFDRA